MATPPTGLSRSDGQPASTTPDGCPRCGMANAPHMRFCNNCGYQLQAEGAQSPSPAASSSGGQAAQPAQAAQAAQPSGQGTVCWRCYGVGDAGADFCKFCGARYADAPSAKPAAAAQPAAQPAAPATAGGVLSASALGAAPISEPAPSFQRPPASERPRPAATSAGAAPLGNLVSILKDGTDGRRYPVYDEQTDIGREEGQIVLTDDPYLSPRHARLVTKGGRAVLRDLDSVNGVYIRIREPVDLTDGDMLLLGQQVLRFELLEETELPLGPATQHGVMVFGTPEVQRIARLLQYTTEGVGRDVHYLYRDETVIGREQGDLVFTDDPFMSRRHAALTIDRASRRFALRDLGSSNGTAMRFRGERALKPGDQFRVGRHLFRFESGDGR